MNLNLNMKLKCWHMCLHLFSWGENPNFQQTPKEVQTEERLGCQGMWICLFFNLSL